jgi:dolichol-phosphate mannosyltransferase
MIGLYTGTKSNLSEAHSLITFPFLHARNFAKRLAYMYFLRGFSMASINLALGAALLAFGTCFGATEWLDSYLSGIPSTPGTVMLAALPILVGFQMFLSFLAHDVAMTPRSPIHEDINSVTVMRPSADQLGAAPVSEAKNDTESR